MKQQRQNRLKTGKVELCACCIRLWGWSLHWGKEAGMLTMLFLSWSSAKGQCKISPRSEHRSKVKIWIISDFLKLVNAVWIVCIEEDGDLWLCYALCWGEPGFLLLDLTQAVTFYWAAVITRDEIAEILENKNKIYLSYTKIFLWSGSLTHCLHKSITLIA